MYAPDPEVLHPGGCWVKLSQGVGAHQGDGLPRVKVEVVLEPLERGRPVGVGAGVNLTLGDGSHVGRLGGFGLAVHASSLEGYFRHVEATLVQVRLLSSTTMGCAYA